MKVEDVSNRLASATRAYNSDPPLDMSLLPDWIVSEITRCLKSAGATDVYKETTATGSITLTCGGKILVIDIELTTRDTSASQASNETPMHLVSVKTSHTSSAPQNEDSSKDESKTQRSLDSLLGSSLNAFMLKAQERDPDCKLVRHLSQVFEQQIRHLLSIDGIAHKESLSGTSHNDWFGGLEETFTIASDLATREAQMVAR
jgi:hypothetical protein